MHEGVSTTVRPEPFVKLRTGASEAKSKDTFFESARYGVRSRNVWPVMYRAASETR